YESGDFVSSLTTPYGTTTFRAGVAEPERDPAKVNRFIEATDPLGDTERLEFRTYSAGSASVKQNQIAPTYYWNKLAWKTAPGDASKAELLHWSQQGQLTVGVLHYDQRAGQSATFLAYADPRLGAESDSGDIAGVPEVVAEPVRTSLALDS